MAYLFVIVFAATAFISGKLAQEVHRDAHFRYYLYLIFFAVSLFCFGGSLLYIILTF